MVLELRGLAGLDREMPGVVGAGGELVHQDLSFGGQEHLDAGHAGAPGGTRRRQRHLTGTRPGVGGDRGGRHDLVADMVALDGLDHGVAGLGPARRAGHHRRQLLLEPDHGLHEHALAGVQAHHRGTGLVLVGAGGVAVAVVAEPPRLQHQGPAEVAPGGGQLARLLHHEERGGRQAGAAQELLLERLVLHLAEGGGIRPHRGAGRLHRGEGAGIDELVLQRDDADARAEGAHRPRVAPVALHEAGGHRGRGLAGRPQHGHADAERPGRQAGHARQLARPRDAHVEGARPGGPCAAGRVGRSDHGHVGTVHGRARKSRTSLTRGAHARGGTRR